MLGKFIVNLSSSIYSKSYHSQLSFRMLLKMSTGTNASMSMGCLWEDAFTIVKIMVIAKTNVSTSSKDALPTVPARFVES